MRDRERERVCVIEIERRRRRRRRKRRTTKQDLGAEESQDDRVIQDARRGYLPLA